MTNKYFIKRGEKIHGPFSTKQVKSGLEEGKLKDADLISESKEGPWQTVAEQFQEAAPVVEVISDDLPTGEDSFFENVEIPSFATPVAQVPTLTKKNEGESTEEGEDTNNNEDNSSLVVCPDCNKQVSKRAASCPHCGAPLKAFNVDDAKVKAKAMFGVLKQKAESLKETVEANRSIAGSMSKAKEVAKDAVEQASELKKSTSQQLEEGGAKAAGKHLASSFASPKFRVLAVTVGICFLLIAYLLFFRGPSLSPEFAEQVDKFQKKLTVGINLLQFSSELQDLAATSSDLPDEQRILDIYEDSGRLWGLSNFGQSEIARSGDKAYEIAQRHPEIVRSYDEDEDYYFIHKESTQILWQKAEAITN